MVAALLPKFEASGAKSSSTRGRHPESIARISLSNGQHISSISSRSLYSAVCTSPVKKQTRNALDLFLVLSVISDYVNVLLVFVPLGLVAGAADWSPVAVFVLNFLAIIPLAACLSFATEELSSRLGEALGGLLNATFGNAVELIVSLTISIANTPEVDTLYRLVSSLFGTTRSRL